ncbi:MAG: peptide ABC transporter substrate-binding protein [Verrucomicrobiota bacterium]
MHPASPAPFTAPEAVSGAFCFSHPPARLRPPPPFLLPFLRTRPSPARRPLPVAAAGLLLLLGLAACQPRPPADLVLHNGPEPETIDPHLLTGLADGRIGAALFEGLTRFNPTNGGVLPALAERWELSPDARTYTFHLRTNAAWSTGETIDAHDLVWSWRRAVDPRTGSDYAGSFLVLRGAEALLAGRERDPATLGVTAADRWTVRVGLVNPTPYFPDLAASRVFAVVPRQAIERWGDRWTRARPLPCSGTYSLEEWRVNDRMRLVRNPHHWDAPAIRSGVVDVLSGESPGTALNLFLTGAVDYLADKNMIPTELNDVLRGRADIVSGPSLGSSFVRFNCTRRPFHDARVRQALCQVVDRRRIVERITRMGEVPSSALVPRGTAGYQPPAGLEQDVARARQLLAEAWFPGGRGFPRFEFAFNAGARVFEQIGVELQAMFREHLGIAMDLRPLEWKTYLAEMSSRNYDLIRSSWVGDFNDPVTFLEIFHSDSGNNRTGWRSAPYDALLTEAAATADPARRHGLLRQAESRLVREEVPILCLYTLVNAFAADPQRVEGLFANPLDEHPFWAIARKPGAGGGGRP